MIERFTRELALLEGYFKSLSSQPLQVTQCEVSYINHIEPAQGEPLRAKDWLGFMSFEEETEPADFAATFRRPVIDDDGKPYGRLIVEAAVGYKVDKSRIFALTLTVRGAPKEASIPSALEFINKGRELIVMRFTQMTTDRAHTAWGRTK